MKFEPRDYSDIIDLPHPTSKKHPKMSNENRAAQFSPFAALTGLDDAIDDTGIKHINSVLENDTNDSFTSDDIS